jgi:hypothetical protein
MPNTAAPAAHARLQQVLDHARGRAVIQQQEATEMISSTVPVTGEAALSAIQ